MKRAVPGVRVQVMGRARENLGGGGKGSAPVKGVCQGRPGASLSVAPCPQLRNGAAPKVTMPQAHSALGPPPSALCPTPSV